jgi:hypothetical protein
MNAGKKLMLTAEGLLFLLLFLFGCHRYGFAAVIEAAGGAGGVGYLGVVALGTLHQGLGCELQVLAPFKLAGFGGFSLR